MLLDWEFANRIKCSDSDKKKCLDIITTAISFSEKARREGLLALDDDVYDLGNEFFKLGIQLVVDGTDPELVRNILELKILANNCKGYDLLSRAIILEGVLSIQSGDNPRIVREKLMSFLPDEFLAGKDAQSYFKSPDSLEEEVT
jgi:flagellar motor component MotA